LNPIIDSSEIAVSGEAFLYQFTGVFAFQY